MSLISDNYTPDQLYEITLDPDKLQSFPGFQRALAMGVADHMTFHHDLPYDEIYEFVKEEMRGVLGGVSGGVMEKRGVTWEHVGSTSIRGMPGTIFPDALILYDHSPPPREVFDALLKKGYTFIGAGPIHPADLWFLKKITKAGSRLDDAIFKIHLTPADLGASRMLIETRDRCIADPDDFQEYKDSKVEAAQHLESGNIMGYKRAKMRSKLIQELNKKHGCNDGSSGEGK